MTFDADPGRNLVGRFAHIWQFILVSPGSHGYNYAKIHWGILLYVTD
jgi:hypothetical protein